MIINQHEKVIATVCNVLHRPSPHKHLSAGLRAVEVFIPAERMAITPSILICGPSFHIHYHSRLLNPTPTLPYVHHGTRKKEHHCHQSQQGDDVMGKWLLPERPPPLPPYFPPVRCLCLRPSLTAGQGLKALLPFSSQWVQPCQERSERNNTDQRTTTG